MQAQHIIDCLELYKNQSDRFEMFSENVRTFFAKKKELNDSPLPIVHSLKARVKDVAHLEDKLNRKWAEGMEITTSNLFDSITDLAGVRVLHLHQEQFHIIHESIMNNINTYNEWVLVEKPKAYIWDKEKEAFYENLGLIVSAKDSNYTSIHYVVKPNADSHICCEIQVRTLFEEIWGEIDHTINYPHQTTSIACKEQIKVLAKLVNAGTRLADSIFASHKEYHESVNPTLNQE